MHRHDVTTTMIMIVLMDRWEWVWREAFCVYGGRTNQRQNCKYNTLLIAYPLKDIMYFVILHSLLSPYLNMDLTAYTFSVWVLYRWFYNISVVLISSMSGFNGKKWVSHLMQLKPNTKYWAWIWANCFADI